MEDLILQYSGSAALTIYLIAFGILLACGFGLPVPEDIILFSLGYLSYRGDVTLVGSIVVALTGVLVGDSTIYAIGRFSGERVLRFPIVRHVLKPKRVADVRLAFENRGNIILFFARFAPGLRAPTFWSAGLFRVPFRTFFLLDGIAALLSVPIFTWVGYLLGETFHERLNDIRDVGLLVGGLALAVVVYFVAKDVLKRRKRNARAEKLKQDQPVGDTEEQDE